eukprot:59814-Rhodomonas_salina.1
MAPSAGTESWLNLLGVPKPQLEVSGCERRLSPVHLSHQPRDGQQMHRTELWNGTTPCTTLRAH